MAGPKKKGPKTRTHPLVKQYVTKVLNPTIKQLAPLVAFSPIGRVYKAAKLVKPVVRAVKASIKTKKAKRVANQKQRLRKRIDLEQQRTGGYDDYDIPLTTRDAIRSIRSDLKTVKLDRGVKTKYNANRRNIDTRRSIDFSATVDSISKGGSKFIAEPHKIVRRSGALKKTKGLPKDTSFTRSGLRSVRNRKEQAALEKKYPLYRDKKK